MQFNNRMKYKVASLPILAILFLHFFTACEDPCAGVTDEEVGGEFFTVEYRDPSGTNYLDIYDPNGLIVFLDTAGGESRNPNFELIKPGYANGKFGPFNFTERYVDPVRENLNSALLFGNQFKFDYYIKKDTFGQDTFSVHFLMGVDECRFYWKSIDYFLNGEPLPQYSGQKQAEIIIIE